MQKTQHNINYDAITLLLREEASSSPFSYETCKMLVSLRVAKYLTGHRILSALSQVIFFYFLLLFLHIMCMDGNKVFLQEHCTMLNTFNIVHT